MSGKEATIIMVQRSVGGVYVPSFQKGALMVPPLVGNFELIPANRPVSYSNGWTGSSMEWRLMRAN